MAAYKKKSTIKLAQLSLLTAIAIILLMLIRIPIIPAAPFLVYDMADVPIIIGTLMYGTIPGIAILLAVSLIQAFLLSGDGIVGLIMHFCSSGALILCIGLADKYIGNKIHKKHILHIVIGMILGTIAMTLVMIPMNYIFTVNFYGVPKEMLDSLILPAIVPFNLIKGTVNCALAGTIYKLLKPFLNKYNYLLDIKTKR